jgi:hypothetical protein
MKRTAYVLLLTALSATGCITFPHFGESAKPPPVTTPTPTLRPKPVVTAEQVNEGNAHEVAGSLLDELDREAHGDVPTTPARPVEGKKP